MNEVFQLFSQLAFPAAVAAVLIWWLLTRLEARLDRLADGVEKLAALLPPVAEALQALQQIIASTNSPRASRKDYAATKRKTR